MTGKQTPANSDAHLVEALKNSIPHIMRQNGTPGLGIALARGGEVIWEQGFGYADLEQKTPPTPQTVLHSGSMGKVYTATVPEADVRMIETSDSGVVVQLQRASHAAK